MPDAPKAKALNVQESISWARLLFFPNVPDGTVYNEMAEIRIQAPAVRVLWATFSLVFNGSACQWKDMDLSALWAARLLGESIGEYGLEGST